MHPVPVFIICYNNGWLVEDTVARLESLVHKFIIIDNASQEPTTQVALRRLAEHARVSVWPMPKNLGPRCFYRPAFWHMMPDYFAVTDPDLEYPDILPKNFIEQLRGLVDLTGFFKAGLALDTSGPPDIFHHYPHVQQQAEHWAADRRMQTPPGAPPIYDAPIDTTFAVYCKKNYAKSMFGPAARVAGNFTVKHRPWYKEFWHKNAHRLRATYDGAVYSTTGYVAAKSLEIAPFTLRPWTPEDPHPPER